MNLQHGNFMDFEGFFYDLVLRGACQLLAIARITSSAPYGLHVSYPTQKHHFSMNSQHGIFMDFKGF